MAKRRRRWEEELERESEHPARPKLAELDRGTRAGVLEELQRAGGNRAFQQVVGGQQLQREAAPARLQSAVTATAFMRIPEIPGPSKVAGHVGEHEVVSLEHDVSVPMIQEVGGRQHEGQPRFSDLNVVIKKSTMTNRFRQFAMGADPIPKVEITSLLEDGTELMTLTGVHVRAIKERSEGGGPTLVYLTLAYDKMTLVTRDKTGKDLDVLKRDQAHWHDQ